MVLTDKDHDRRSRPSRSSGKRTNSDISRQSSHSDGTVPEALSVSRSALPRDNHLRVFKSRANRNAVKQRQMATSPSNSDFTEDDLFRLLIGKIKQREDNDVAAANMRTKLEADISKLQSENKSLKDKVDALGTQLQRRILESRSYKAQIDNWKAKLGKFKRVLTGLGTEYQALRIESDRIKATELSLEKDKREISAAIEEAQGQVTQASSTVSKGKGCLSESHKIVSSLQNSLKSSEYQAESVRTQLVDERRRTAVLESYIQSQSRIQGKHIKSIKEDQLEMMKRTKSGFELISKQWEFSHLNIQSILKPMLEDCLASIKGLDEKYSVEKADIQESTNVIQKFISQ